MKKVYLVDLKNDIVGHWHIMVALSKIQGSELIDTEERKVSRKNPIRLLKERTRMVRSSMKRISQTSRKGDVAHFLTADKFYYLFWLFPGCLKDISILFTLHSFPRSKFLQWCLRCVSKRIDGIVVLSDFLKSQLISIGINNVSAIEHPSFYDYSTIESHDVLKAKMNISDYFVVSALGATRYNKGIDILLEAFKFIPNDIKEHLVLNVAGKATDFGKDYISAKCKEYGIRLLDRIRTLEVEEFKASVLMSDLIVVPYRKTFNNVSGPMSEALALGIPCILPRHGIFMDYIAEQGESLSFDSECPESLAEAIVRQYETRIVPDETLKEKYQLTNFIRKHEELYESLER